MPALYGNFLDFLYAKQQTIGTTSIYECVRKLFLQLQLERTSQLELNYIHFAAKQAAKEKQEKWQYRLYQDLEILFSISCWY